MSVIPEGAPRSLRFTLGAIVLGLALQSYHYLRNPSVWHDEGALVANILTKGFRELTGPLDWYQAAPPLFLWLERAATRVLGDSTYVLRLVPFLSGCLALLLFARVAWRRLPAAAVPAAVLLFACSDRLLRHACEVKPYATDALLAAAALALFDATGAWLPGRRLLLFTALAPGMILLSYPGCFVCCGLVAALVPALWRDGRRQFWLLLALWAAVAAGTFLLLFCGPIRAQQNPELTAYWQPCFPDWGRPWLVPVWAVRATLDVAGYCCNPFAEFGGVLAAVGVIAFWRRGDRTLLGLLAVPVGLALAAGSVGAYPYGGLRTMFYAAPAVVLLAAAGLVAIADGLRCRAGWAQLLVPALLALPLGNALHRVWSPWTRSDAVPAATHVLGQFQPGDAIAVNSWEFLYYFRHQGGAVTMFTGDQLPAAAGRGLSRRTWFVLVGAEPAYRQRLAERAARGADLLGRHDFRSVTVLLLGHAAAGM